MLYRKKPVVIEARLLTVDNAVEVSNWCSGDHRCHERDGLEVPAYLEIYTLEGVMRANIGDYIIKGVNGEFYPCKSDIFAKTYEKA